MLGAGAVALMSYNARAEARMPHLPAGPLSNADAPSAQFEGAAQMTQTRRAR
jgi:hypothetical protein